MTVERIPQEYLERIKARICLSDIVGKDIPLKRAGREFKSVCPFHAEKTPSFFVNDQKQMFHCFGCGAHGDHVGWLMRYGGMEFKQAVEHLAGEKPPTEAQRFENNLRARSREHLSRSVYDFRLSDEELGQQAMAQSIWDHAGPIDGTLAETYLRARGNRLKRWPPCFRFMPDAWVFGYETGWRRSGRPGLISGVQDSADRVTAIQTTYLLPDGSWKAPIKRSKIVLGPMTDGAIRLAEAGPVLCVAEGSETGMAAQSMFSLPVWASAGQARRRNIHIPDIVRTVVILRDNGTDKFNGPTTDAARQSYIDQGKEVMIESPPDEFGDFDDMRAGRRREVAA